MAVLSKKYVLSVILIQLFISGFSPAAIGQTPDSLKAGKIPSKIDFGIGFTSARIDQEYCFGMELGYNVRMKRVQIGVDIAGYERNTSNKYGYYYLNKPGLNTYRTGLNGQYIVNLTDRFSFNPSLTAAYTRFMLQERKVDYVTAKHGQKSTAKESYLALIPGANFRYQFDWGGAVILSAGYQKLVGPSSINDFSSRRGNEGWIYGISFELDLNY